MASSPGGRKSPPKFIISQSPKNMNRKFSITDVIMILLIIEKIYDLFARKHDILDYIFLALAFIWAIIRVTQIIRK